MGLNRFRWVCLRLTERRAGRREEEADEEALRSPGRLSGGLEQQAAGRPAGGLKAGEEVLAHENPGAPRLPALPTAGWEEAAGNSLSVSVSLGLLVSLVSRCLWRVRCQPHQHDSLVSQPPAHP